MLEIMVFIWAAALIVAFDTLFETEEETLDEDDAELVGVADAGEFPIIGNELTRLFKRTKLVFNLLTFWSLWEKLDKNL